MNDSGLHVAKLWPELFVGLSDRQIEAIENACGANWHEGWEPNREDVADLCALVRGEITREELWRRAGERANRSR